MTEFELSLLSELRAIRVAIEQFLSGNANVSIPAKPIEKTSLSQNQLQPQSALNQQAKNESTITKYYFGTPDGLGFEQCNAVSDSDSPKVLYVIETTDGINGHFYPLNRGLARLRSNASAFLMPLCELSVPLETLDNLNIPASDYGEVILCDDYWKVTRKCVISN